MHIFSEISQDGACGLCAGKTPLGWVLHGRDGGFSNSVSCSVNLQLESQTALLTNSLCPCQFDYVDRACDHDVLQSSLDDECAEMFVRRTCVYNNWHYRIDIPWKERCPNLPNNYQMAMSRLNSLANFEIRSKYT